jgi:hypothetical protein
VPLGVIDKEKLIEKIKAISPKGKTPITLSVKTTAEKLKTLEDETTVILVSDGKETCEGDPCALVKQLKESGVRFVMHVIGFDVTEEERNQLECIAGAGGGTYYAAKNAGEKGGMMQKRIVGFITVMFVALAFLLFYVPVQVAEFTADWFNTRQSVTNQGKTYVKDDMICIEVLEDPQNYNKYLMNTGFLTSEDV